MWTNPRNVFYKTRAARKTLVESNYRSLQLYAGSNDISIIFGIPRKRLPKIFLRLVFTSDVVVVRVVIRSVERYDLVKIKPTESEAEQ